jgi:hypothetical protein
MTNWQILRRFGTFYDHLLHFVFLWYIISGSGNIYQEKSGIHAGGHGNFFQSKYEEESTVVANAFRTETGLHTLSPGGLA